MNVNDERGDEIEMGYYDVSSSELWDKRVCQAKSDGFMWATDFPNHEPSFHEARKFYHANSKLLLCLFYNEITNKKEMRHTTKTIEKSYGKKNFNVF